MFGAKFLTPKYMMASPRRTRIALPSGVIFICLSLVSSERRSAFRASYGFLRASFKADRAPTSISEAAGSSARTRA